jgi:hypothetical protein
MKEKFSPEAWLDANGSGHGIIWLWNSWQQDGLKYDHKRIESVIETFRQPGVANAALGWYR